MHNLYIWSGGVSHVIVSCQRLATERNNIFCEYKNLCTLTKNNICFDEILKSEEITCQFILDPSSLNLPVRVSSYDPILPQFYRLSRDMCFILDKTRIGLLRQMEKDRKSS